MNPFYELAKNLRDRGVDQKTIYESFSKAREDCMAPVGVDEFYWEDDILDTLDCIPSCCSPRLSLFPDGMDHKELESE